MAWIKDLFCSSATLRLQSVPRFFSHMHGDGAAALHGNHFDGDRRPVTSKHSPLRPSPLFLLTLRPKILTLAVVTPDAAQWLIHFSTRSPIHQHTSQTLALTMFAPKIVLESRSSPESAMVGGDKTLRERILLLPRTTLVWSRSVPKRSGFSRAGQ